MSKEVDRAQVLKTTKVRKALKTDASWIHKSKQENDRTERAAEAGPIPAKNMSFVSSAAKKFESAVSTESRLNPPLKKTQLTPSKGDSVKKGNVKALAGELGTNIEAQQNKLDPTTAAENKEAHAAAPTDHSDVQCSKVPGDANVKDLGTSDMAGEKCKDPAEGSAPNAVQVKPNESSGTKPVKATPLPPAVVKPTKPPSNESCKTVPPTQVVAKTAEANATVKVSPSPETPAVESTKQNKNPAPQLVASGSKSPNQSADTGENKDPVKVPAQVAVELKAVEPAVTTEPVKATPLAPAVVKPTEPPAKESYKTVPPTQVVAKTVEVKTAPQNSVEPVCDMGSKSTSPSVGGNSVVVGTEKNKGPSEVTSEVPVKLKTVEPPVTTEPVNASSLPPAVTKPTEPPAKESYKTVPPTQVVAKTAEAKANVEFNPSPQTPAFHIQNKNPAPQPVPNTGSKSPNQSAGTGENKDAVKVPVAVELKAVEPEVTTEPVKASPLAPAVVKPTEPPSNESCKTVPPTQVVAKTVEVKTAPQNSVEPVSDTGPNSPNKSGGETAVRSAEPKVKPAVTAEPVVKTTPGAAEKEALPAQITTEQQSMNPVSANTVEEGGDAQDAFSGQTIELRDALDEVPPTAESVPEPVNDPKRSHSKGTEPNQSDDTNGAEKFHKPKEKLQSPYPEKKTRHGKAVCSFCDQVIGGNVKITFSEPPLTCHSECLKCGVCAKDLGDLLIPIYLHDQLFHCKGCFLKALKT